jgi:tripartite-type tricarboxylate transporter receptor subunit TctC
MGCEVEISGKFRTDLRGGTTMRTRGTVILIFLIFLGHLSISMAAEPGYPTRPIEIIVGMAPGGGGDVGARMLAENSKKYLGQEVIVVNKPGGYNKIAYTLVTKAKPDGYTLGAGSDGSITMAPHLEKMSYNHESFTFIVQFGQLAQGFVVLEDSPFRQLKDVIEFARTNPDKLTISTLGAGSTTHMPWEYLALVENLKIKLVPFSGAAPAVTALLGGHVMVASTSFTGFNPYLRARKVRLLAVTTEERMENYPDVPTLKELGYSTLVLVPYHVIIGPKNIEKSIVSRLVDAFKKGMEAPSFIKANQDLEMYKKNPLWGDELKETMIRQDRRYGELVKKLGLRVKE